ncbi:hypothetical protein LTR78_007639 [Recurvomyces mirabilis]|uniref:DUF7603 domain-containing protein n=1 Tax=Recurvomyces mirabilis TaxID=574656 RepID=A0AAE0WJA6_9PEZI|nr:hypothetical protein LTR78_007639 [Recurvomyces mirabilis]KAK5159850.1 hypothetical protein LTS14_001955 [Recurvomyces mirabilis]
MGSPSHSRSSSFGADDYYSESRVEHTAEDTHGYDAYEQEDAVPAILKTQSSLAHIQVPSFRSFASSIPVPSPSTTKRKPPPFALARSPRAASFSLAERASPRLAEPSSRPFSLDSPLPQQPNGLLNQLSPPLTEDFTAQQEDRASHSYPYTHGHDRNESIDSRLLNNEAVASNRSSRRSSIPVNARYAHDQARSHAPKTSISSSDYSAVEHEVRGRRSMHIQQAPSMTLQQFDGVQRTLSDSSLLSEPTSLRDQRLKSPGRRAFFGWKSSSQRSGSESPTTTFSDRSLSPLPSPGITKPFAGSPMEGSVSTTRLTPSGLDIQKANARNDNSIYFENPDTPILLGSPETNAHVRELERELHQISSELAGSIKREMDLEDELYRLSLEMPSSNSEGRRSSDYFSDSGASSVRYPVTDPDARLVQMETKLRKAEQEKAQIKVDVASTMQSELARRRDLEQIVHALEEQLHKRFDEDERVTELEKNLDESRRRMEQERQAKDSFGDLYSATKLELVQHQNERDNLRDETVPNLRSRIEGLEAEAGDVQAIMYENTRLQQELAALKEAQSNARFGSIAEEGVPMSPVVGRGSLSRSNSLARNRSVRGGSITRTGSVLDRAEGGGRQRSGSVSAHQGPVSSEAVKEIEDQRDALHKALRLLISRHEKQQREHERAVKKLTRAKQQAETVTPKRTAYHAEVAFLKDEVTTLRKRTEDALEQKWQYEKGLSGVKMDLDRAEQETKGLRDLLQESNTQKNRHSVLSGYGSDYGDDEDVPDNMKLSISSAEHQRDNAREAAEDYRQRAASVDPSNAQALMSSAQRMEQLADRLEEQVQANVQLRDRLAEAVEKGEKEQKVSTGQIEDMQRKLAGMEDSVLEAQQHSETMLGNHETEVRRISEATSPSLQRLRISIPDAKRLSPAHSPLLPGSRSPRISKKRLSGATLSEASRTQALERKVRELEKLLREAEDDVQVVVRRVNRSQFEVAELQTERDAAMVQMRKLAALVEEERTRGEGLIEKL